MLQPNLPEAGAEGEPGEGPGSRQEEHEEHEGAEEQHPAPPLAAPGQGDKHQRPETRPTHPSPLCSSHSLAALQEARQLRARLRPGCPTLREETKNKCLTPTVISSCPSNSTLKCDPTKQTSGVLNIQLLTVKQNINKYF